MIVVRIGTSRLTLQPGRYDVGRSLDCSISLDDLQASRQHARLNILSAEHCFVEDLASRNGTLVNGKAIEPNQPVRLREGDVIRIGDHQLRIERLGTTVAPDREVAPPPPRMVAVTSPGIP